VCSPPRPASGEWPRPSSERWTSTAPGGSPSISDFGTEIISVVTIHGNDSRANRKVHVFERQRDVRSEVVIRSELTVSADCSKLLSFAPITARPPMRPRRRSGCFQPSVGHQTTSQPHAKNFSTSLVHQESAEVPQHKDDV
jgi:hypothetical protein